MTKLKRVVQAEDLYNIPITYEGTNYSPVTHREAILTIKEYLYKHNFTIENETYLTASGGQRVVGKYGIKYNDEFDYMLAFSNSHDGSISFRYTSGSMLKICSNGSIWGSEDTYKRKHVGTAQIDIISTLESKIHLLEETMRINEQHSKRMKEIEIGKETIAKLVGDAFLYEEMLRANQMAVLKKEIHNPSFNYNADNSLWELYNHFTFAARESTPTEWVQRHTDISNYFVNAAGILESKRGLLGSIVPETADLLTEALVI